MLQIHPNARTTPVIRAEVARSGEPTGLLAQRYGVSTETIRKWRKRGAEDCLDHSAKPHHLPWKARDEKIVQAASHLTANKVKCCCRRWMPAIAP